MAQSTDSAPSVADIVSKHSGLGVLRRLLLVANSSSLAAQSAVDAMVEYITSQTTPNMTYYQHLVSKFSVEANPAWLEQVQADMEQNAVVHERQLNIATANQSRDNIRVRFSPRQVLHRLH